MYVAHHISHLPVGVGASCCGHSLRAQQWLDECEVVAYATIKVGRQRQNA